MAEIIAHTKYNDDIPVGEAGWAELDYCEWVGDGEYALAHVDHLEYYHGYVIDPDNCEGVVLELGGINVRVVGYDEDRRAVRLSQVKEVVNHEP